MKKDYYNKFRLILFAFFFLLLILDGVSKYWVSCSIPYMSSFFPTYPYGGIGIFDCFGVSFSINYIANKGAAWGLFSSYSSILFIFRIIIVVSLLIYLIFFLRDKLKFISMLAITTGAIGNIIDMIMYGQVIDFIHFNFWGYSFPLFNIADSMICIGITSLLLISFFSKKPMGQRDEDRNYCNR